MSNTRTAGCNLGKTGYICSAKKTIRVTGVAKDVLIIYLSV
jgi:D-alanyl-D-alanine carboxypeptidase